MCGIVGYKGKRNVKEVLLNALETLEYRGYDSAGIAVLDNNKIRIVKSVGKIENLREKLNVMILIKQLVVLLIQDGLLMVKYVKKIVTLIK